MNEVNYEAMSEWFSARKIADDARLLEELAFGMELGVAVIFEESQQLKGKKSWFLAEQANYQSYSDLWKCVED